MNVLIVTTFRTREVTEPATHMTSDVEVVEVDSSAGMITRDIRVLFGTVRAIRQHDPDVVLLDCYESMGFLAATICLLFRIPIVPRLIGDNWRTIGEEEVLQARESGLIAMIRTRLSYLLNLYIYSLAAGFVVVSNDLRKTVLYRTSCPPERIIVVPLPLTTFPEGSGNAARDRFAIDENHIVLTVTNLNFKGKYEGVKTSLEDLREIVTSEDVGYVIAGGGYYYDRLVDYVNHEFDENNLRGSIYVLGWVDNVEDLYDLADVFAYISYIDGYPNVVIEARAAGLPVIANAAHGMLDQIEDGEDGFLIDPQNSGELKSHVARLLGDEHERERIGDAAQERVYRENDPTVIGRRLEEALNTILSNH